MTFFRLSSYLFTFSTRNTLKHKTGRGYMKHHVNGMTGNSLLALCTSPNYYIPQVQGIQLVPQFQDLPKNETQECEHFKIKMIQGKNDIQTQRCSPDDLFGQHLLVDRNYLWHPKINQKFPSDRDIFPSGKTHLLLCLL